MFSKINIHIIYIYVCEGFSIILHKCLRKTIKKKKEEVEKLENRMKWEH